MGVHGPLGLAGGAGGVDQDGQVLGLELGHALRHRLRVMGQVVAAQSPQLIQPDHHRVIEAAQALEVEDDDVPEPGQLLAHFQGLVELLVVFDKQHGGSRVLAQVLHLSGGVGRINAVGHRRTAEHGQIGHDPLAAGVGQNGSDLAAGQSQVQQAGGHLTHDLPDFGPALALPDAQLFLAQPGVLAARLHRVPEQGRDGLAFEDHAGLGLDQIGLPEVHAITASSSSFSSAARPARRHP